MDREIKRKIRDCLSYLKNNYHEDIDTMDSITGLEEILEEQQQSIKELTITLNIFKDQCNKDGETIKQLKQEIDNLKCCGTCIHNLYGCMEPCVRDGAGNDDLWEWKDN